jgi:carboxyl-terminal processing protease
MNRTLLALALLGGIQIAAFAQATQLPAFDLSISREDRLKVFDEACKAVDKYFFDPNFNGFDWRSIKSRYRLLAESAADKIQLQRVLQNMFNELHTSHMFVNMSFSFGTGLILYKLDQQSLVSYVDPGSPADRAGVQPGWAITSWKGDCWNGEPSNTIGFLSARGPQSQSRVMDIACMPYPHAPDRIERASRMPEPGVAYISFTKFRGGADVWLAAEVAKYGSASAIILDLRGNRGGDVNEVIRCLSHFFSQSVVIGRFQPRKGAPLTMEVKGRKDAYAGKLLVLIDGRTGSGGDMFAAAIQDTARGILIGRRTAGAILLGREYKLPQGFTADVAWGDYFTAKNIRLEGRGVAPDEPVNYTSKDFRENNDPDLDRALAMPGR